MNSDHTLIFSPIDSHADDDIDTAGHEGVDERHHEMSLVSDDGHEAKKGEPWLCRGKGSLQI